MMNIALFQMIVEKDIEDNFNKICKVIEYKLKKNTDIFVLPETALTGYLGFSLERLEKLSSPKIFEYLNIISKLAEKKHIAIVIGQYMKRCGKWYNNLLFFGDDGKCLNSYDKSHLVDYDCFEVCAGNQPKVFEYKGVKMMLGICHDIRYPEHAMVGGDQGQEKIRQVTEWFAQDESHNIVYTFHNEKQNKDVYMVALRDSGKLIGYYEKHEYRDRETMKMYDLW